MKKSSIIMVSNICPICKFGYLEYDVILKHSYCNNKDCTLNRYKWLKRINNC